MPKSKFFGKDKKAEMNAIGAKPRDHLRRSKRLQGIAADGKQIVKRTFEDRVQEVKDADKRLKEGRQRRKTSAKEKSLRHVK
jgi:hypothetical protein